jgi:hypothetical protein
VTSQEPITPPPELVQQWLALANQPSSSTPATVVATAAARWGADQELEACCKWLPKLPPWSADDLRRHRRPEPTLKEQARDALGRFFSNAHTHASQMTQDFDLLRRAVEQLQ